MVTCPVCKNPLPFWSAPTSKRQYFNRTLSFSNKKSVQTCPLCGSEVDRKGRLVKKNEKGLKEYEDKLSREEYLKEKARLKAQEEHKKK
jgi:hypothetical protein